jgi:phage-related protein
MKRWSRGETLPREVKALGGGLKELRVNVGNDPYRVLFFSDSPVHDVVVLAVYKNQRSLPKDARDLAQQRMKQWRKARGARR